MEEIVRFDPFQQLTTGDANALGTLARTTLDHLLADIGVTTKKFAGFNVSISPPTSIIVASGRYYAGDGRFYGNYDEGGVEIDFIEDLPAAAERIAAVVAFSSQTDTQVEPRTFVLDAETRQTEARSVATRNRRRAEIDYVLGEEGATPARPAIPSNYVVIGWVTLTPAGVDSYERNTADVIQGVGEIDVRLDANDLWRLTVGTLLDTLVSQIAGLSARLREQATLGLVLDVARDVAQIKETINLPDDYSFWSVDHFLNTDDSDTENVDYLCRVEEGARFPMAAEGYFSLALANPLDPFVKLSANFALPAWTAVTRISSKGKDAELSLAQHQYQTVEYIKKTRTRKRIRWGVPFNVCTNKSFWKSGEYDSEKGTFERDGETFSVTYVRDTNHSDHKIYRLQQYWKDKITVHHWKRLVSTVSYSGGVVGQTFLNTQEGWMTGVNLFFSKKAATGNVTVLFAECLEDGSPDQSSVLGETVVAVADLKVWPEETPVDFVPILIEKGKRYCYIIQSTGNHFLCETINNKFAQGSRFYSTDGAWFQGSITNDIAFEVKFAKFDTNRVEVQLQPVSLSGGIAAIDILAEIGEPDGTTVEFYAQINGVWKLITDYESNPLIGLPALVNLKMAFVGTTDMMPGIGLNNLSRLYVWRQRSDFRHISTERTMPAAIDTIYVDLRLEAWRGSEHHTCDCTILSGALFADEELPATTVDEPDPLDDFAIIRRLTFDFTPGTISSYKVNIEGTTDNVLTCFHVAERVDVAVDIP